MLKSLRNNLFLLQGLICIRSFIKGWIFLSLGDLRCDVYMKEICCGDLLCGALTRFDVVSGDLERPSGSSDVKIGSGVTFKGRGDIKTLQDGPYGNICGLAFS